MRRFLSVMALAVPLLALGTGAFAVPSVDEVQAQVKQGNYAQAETMMSEVVAAKPGSAKAHYIYAEILAHNARFDDAVREAAKAHELDPATKFTEPEKFRAFQNMLDREQRAARAPSSTQPAAVPQTPVRAAPERSSGVPGWVWGLGLAVIAVLLWRGFSASRRAAGVGSGMPAGAGYSTGGYSGGGYAGGPGFGPGQPGYGAPTRGSGMLGTGLAAAGGFAAGMLAEKVLDGHGDHGNSQVAARDDGLVPGSFGNSSDSSAANDLERRSVDFGSGDGWGDDGSSSVADAGGDMGGGGGDDDGW